MCRHWRNVGNFKTTKFAEFKTRRQHWIRETAMPAMDALALSHAASFQIGKEEMIRSRKSGIRSFVRSFVHSLVERSDQFKKFLNQCFLFSLQTLDLRTPTTTSSTSQMHASSSSMWKYEAKLIIYFLLRCALVSPSYSVSLFSTKIIAAKTNRFREGQLPLL